MLIDENLYPVRGILTRKTPNKDEYDELRIIGGGRELVVERTDEFSAPFVLDITTANEEYELTKTPEEVDAEIAAKEAAEKEDPSPVQVDPETNKPTLKTTPKKTTARKAPATKKTTDNG